jgi:hypothetical protein
MRKDYELGYPLEKGVSENVVKDGLINIKTCGSNSLHEFSFNPVGVI